ncbi:MBL fold metallo-hydrolase [Sulfobacillus harzensis]|uniref:MBL fold metallo-hydrolase n=1 Tax=Sulfobacillus harzensis TaxID=2729629 RepID=UPI001FACEC30|nr:MBL fold metallo-hydrolase [Sulfobacillus harzensis]
MIFVPLWDHTRGCASFLVGDDVVGQGLVVDPLGQLGADSYILEAADWGLAITAVVETHVHADHPSAARELADKLGIRVSLSHRAPVAYAVNPLHQDDAIDLGQVHVQVWETPGHTPDSLSLVVTDRTRSPEPWLILSGDRYLWATWGAPIWWRRRQRESGTRPWINITRSTAKFSPCRIRRNCIPPIMARRPAAGCF